jgi:hypothetical protein
MVMVVACEEKKRQDKSDEISGREFPREKQFPKVAEFDDFGRRIFLELEW